MSQGYIFETPDGGNTIYKRKAGSTVKELHWQDPSISMREVLTMRSNRLLTILRLSETDITLRDALEKLEALYILKYGNDKND